MKKLSKKCLSLLLAGAMTCSLAACGASDSSTESTSTSSAAEGTAAVTESASGSEGLTTVNFQLKWLPSVQFMGFYVAYEKGYYEDEGIDLNIMSGGSDIVSASQVGIGAADIGVSNLYGLLPYEEDGYPIVEVGQVFQTGSIVLVSLAENGIESPEDLLGKKIGAWMGTADYPIYSLLNKYDIDTSEVTMVSQDYTMDGLISGELDAASATLYNEYLVLLESGYSEDEVNVISFSDYDCDMLEDAIICNTEWLEGNEDIVEAFLRASMRGWADAVADPEGAANIVWDYVDQSSTTLEHQIASAEKVAELVTPTTGADASQMLALVDEKIQATIDSCVNYEIIEAEPETVYDSTYWEAASESLQ